MERKKNLPSTLLIRLLISLASCVQLPTVATADQSSGLTSKIDSIDAAPKTGVSDTTLGDAISQGEVEKHGGSSYDSGKNTTENSGGRHQSVNAGFQPESASLDLPENSRAFKLAIQKLAGKEKLTSDDYRSLGIGVLGIEADRQLFSKSALITGLYRGCPAEAAGIRVGDWEVLTNDPDSQKDTHGLTQFICGLAGKPVDITIKRHGHELHFHLVRMNIEDIPDDRLRRRYEHLVLRMRTKLVRAYPQLDPKILGY